MAEHELDIYGGFGYNYLILANTTVSDSEIVKVGELDYDPKWDSVSGDPFIILANFDETLQSSRKNDIGEVLSRWSVYRKQENDDKLIMVGTVDNAEFSIIDPMAGNNKHYTYYVYPETENLIGDAMVTNMIKNESGWSYTIANLLERSDGVYVSNEIWNLRLNVESNEIVQNLDITSFETLGKYEKINKGDKNYLTTSITALLGNINDQTGKYDTDIEKVNKWRDFISGSDKYIWKDRLGDVRVVAIADNPSVKYLDETSEQATQVSFSVKEVMDVNELTNGVIGDYKDTLDKSYTHVQLLSSDRWVVTHALNKFPKVTIVDLSGKIIYAQVTHINRQIADIRFSRPVIGTAYFN